MGDGAPGGALGARPWELCAAHSCSKARHLLELTEEGGLSKARPPILSASSRKDGLGPEPPPAEATSLVRRDCCAFSTSPHIQAPLVFSCPWIFTPKPGEEAGPQRSNWSLLGRWPWTLPAPSLLRKAAMVRGLRGCCGHSKSSHGHRMATGRVWGQRERCSLLQWTGRQGGWRGAVAPGRLCP